MFDLTGRSALVTGAGSAEGIGFAAARALRDAGARVTITSTTERIHERAAELGGCDAAVADLTDPAQAQRLVDAAGDVDILVNNAGMAQVGAAGTSGRFLETTPEQWSAAIARNLLTAVHTTRAALPGMVERGHGRIVMVSSVTGPLVANPGDASYPATKAGLDGLMRAIAIEHGRDGVTANSVNPGWIATASSSPRELEAGAQTPVGRPGRPDEVAAAIVFLASDEASYVSGRALVVDGGNLIQEHKGRE